VLGLVGLGIRARRAVAGVTLTREAARKGTVVFALVASDISRNSLDKVVPLLKAKKVPMISGFSAAELGSVTGREATAVIGIVDHALAGGIQDALRIGDGSAS
jgi:ribosomal protein L7Ae-like RNA K-turn-binding protein